MRHDFCKTARAKNKIVKDVYKVERITPQRVAGGFDVIPNECEESGFLAQLEMTSQSPLHGIKPNEIKEGKE